MIADIISKIKEKIVVIKNPDGSNGTGIVLDNRGIIVTNSHVVSGCRVAGIETNDERSFIGKVIQANKSVDYAFIHCEGLKTDDPPVLSTRSSILEGEDVVAIGHPYGYGFTVTKGIVSSLGREVKGVEYIQTDVPINPGNSGGPLIDSRGEIIGINTWIVSNAQSLSFAVPSKYLIDAYDSLPSIDQMIAGSYCTSCGKLNEDETKYCNFCGHEIKDDRVNNEIYMNTGFCLKCKTQNSAEEKYCSKCGAELLRKKEEAKPEDKSSGISPDETMVCPGCGTENRGNKYCSNCGKTLVTK